MKNIVTNNEQETYDFGVNLGKDCRGGEIFVLNGDLGTGKTKLLQGLAFGLGVKDKVNSPTFNIMKVYHLRGAIANRGIHTFCHIDAYRLKSAHDLSALGIQEFFEDAGVVTAIEWGEKVEDVLPDNCTYINISHLDENSREITIL